MAFRIYSPFLKDILTVVFKSASSSSGLQGALSATPNVIAVGLSSSYVYAPTHSTYASISAYVTGLVQTINGEDTTALNTRNGCLWLADGGPGVLGATPGTAASIAVYVEHDTWTRLIGHWGKFDGSPFVMVAGDSPVIRWPRTGVGLFELLNQMSGEDRPYPYLFGLAMESLLGGSTRNVLSTAADPGVTVSIEWLSKAAHMVWGHKTLADIPADWRVRTDAAAPPTITGKTSTQYRADSAGNNAGAYMNVTDAAKVWTAPMGDKPVSKLLVYQNTGTASTSYLIGMWQASTHSHFNDAGGVVNTSVAFDTVAPELLGLYSLRAGD